MKLGDVKRADVDRVALIPSQRVRILWANGYWDGPLDGVAEYEGRRVLFTVIDDFLAGDPPREARRLWLVELTAEQLAEEEYWHRLFHQHVGTHMDYDADGSRSVGALASSQPRRFYDEYEKRPEANYSENEVLGWFEL